MKLLEKWMPQAEINAELASIPKQFDKLLTDKEAIEMYRLGYEIGTGDTGEFQKAKTGDYEQYIAGKDVNGDPIEYENDGKVKKVFIKADKIPVGDVNYIEPNQIKEYHTESVDSEYDVNEFIKAIQDVMKLEFKSGLEGKYYNPITIKLIFNNVKNMLTDAEKQEILDAYKQAHPEYDPDAKDKFTPETFEVWMQKQDYEGNVNFVIANKVKNVLTSYVKPAEAIKDVRVGTFGRSSIHYGDPALEVVIYRSRIMLDGGAK